jgi:NADH-quinone oxidoreductase subunit L
MTLPLIVLSTLCFFAFFSLNPIDANVGWFTKYVPAPHSIVPDAQRFEFQREVQTEANEPSVYAEELHHVHYTAMTISLICAGLGILLAFAFYKWKKFSADAFAEKIKPLYNFSLNKWYFDEFYEGVIVAATLGLTRVLRWFDNTIIDGAVNGAAYITKKTSKGSGKFDNGFIDGLVNLVAGIIMFFGLLFRKIQTGKIQTYLAYVLFGIIVFYFIFRSM